MRDASTYDEQVAVGQSAKADGAPQEYLDHLLKIMNGAGHG